MNNRPACFLALCAALAPSAPAAAAATIPPSFHLRLSGKVHDAYAIHMDLTREGGNLHGSYFYESSGKDIALDGTLGDDGAFAIAESSAGKETGTFKGEVDLLGGDRPVLRLQGIWTKAGGSVGEPFYAVADDPQLPPAYRLLSETIKKKGDKVKINYPRVAGPDSAGIKGFNEAARALVSQKMAEDEAAEVSIDFSYDYVSQDLASVAFTVASSEKGAAHGNYYRTNLNYDLAHAQPISLPSLFKGGSDYLPRLSRFCIAKLKEDLGGGSDEAWIGKGASPDADNYGSWGIGWDGIIVRFPPYQVASYADGEQEVVVPWSEIKDLLDPESPVAPLLAPASH